MRFAVGKRRAWLRARVQVHRPQVRRARYLRENLALPLLAGTSPPRVATLAAPTTATTTEQTRQKWRMLKVRISLPTPSRIRPS
jgi:hypothetical protein